MATHMLENGADVRYIQAMLGHANLNATEIYTQVSIKKLKQVHTLTHPAKTRRSKVVDWEEGEGEPSADDVLAVLPIESEQEGENQE